MRKPPGFFSRILGKMKNPAQGQMPRVSFNPLISKEISAALRKRAALSASHGRAGKSRTSLTARAISAIGAMISARAPGVGGIPGPVSRSAPEVTSAAAPVSTQRLPTAAGVPSNIIAFPGCEAFLPQSGDLVEVAAARLPLPARLRQAFVPYVAPATTSWEIMSAEERSAYIFSQWNSGKCIRTPS